jgi:hypothetical protein
MTECNIVFKDPVALMYLFCIHVVTCQRIARQRLDKHPALHARNDRTMLCNSFLGNGSVNTLPRER